MMKTFRFMKTFLSYSMKYLQQMKSRQKKLGHLRDMVLRARHVAFVVGAGVIPAPSEVISPIFS